MDIYNDDYILAEGEKNGAYPESLAKEKEIGRKQRETFRAAHAAGVMEAIQAATRSAAEALDRTADVGAIAPGRYADLIAVDGDPLTDVRVLESVAVVMKGGQIVKGSVP
jgi:cytosine/adenosine deaminase-related metal-dependent hydrolase